jgi:KUP system potassium uptake protein
LLCRHAKVSTIPNQHRTDEELTTYSRTTFHERSFAAKTKRWLENGTSRKNALLILVLVGTCMVIGDGILTPAISVLSAAGGLRVNLPHINNGIDYYVKSFVLQCPFTLAMIVDQSRFFDCCYRYCCCCGCCDISELV